MVTTTKLKVLDPVTEPFVQGVARAPRLGTLDGKVIGLYNNEKRNAARLLDLVADILAERYDIREVVRGAYSSSRLMRRDEWKDVERCDAIILTHGD